MQPRKDCSAICNLRAVRGSLLNSRMWYSGCVSHQIDAMSSEPSSETATRVRWILADPLLPSGLQIELVAV
jgi:hypothetical protein